MSVEEHTPSAGGESAQAMTPPTARWPCRRHRVAFEIAMLREGRLEALKEVGTVNHYVQKTSRPKCIQYPSGYMTASSKHFFLFTPTSRSLVSWQPSMRG